MTTEAPTEQSIEHAQSEWDAVAKERETGIALPAEKPQVAETVKPPVVADPVQELRETIAKLEARTRNAEGQIGGLNRNQLSMQETLQAASKAASQVNSAPTKTQIQEAMQDPAEWASLKKDFPDWATATEKYFDARLAQMKGQSIDPAQIARIVQEQVAGQTAAVRTEIINTSLDAVYPGWQDDVKSDEFGQWMLTQPDDVKKMAESSSVKDAAKMLALYQQSKVSNPSADIIAARKQKLANAVTTQKGTKSIPQKAFEDMTPQEQWNYEAAQRDKARAKRY